MGAVAQDPFGVPWSCLVSRAQVLILRCLLSRSCPCSAQLRLRARRDPADPGERSADGRFGGDLESRARGDRRPRPGAGRGPGPSARPTCEPLGRPASPRTRSRLAAPLRGRPPAPRACGGDPSAPAATPSRSSASRPKPQSGPGRLDQQTASDGGRDRHDSLNPKFVSHPR